MVDRSQVHVRLRSWGLLVASFFVVDARTQHTFLLGSPRHRKKAIPRASPYQVGLWKTQSCQARQPFRCRVEGTGARRDLGGRRQSRWHAIRRRLCRLRVPPSRRRGLSKNKTPHYLDHSRGFGLLIWALVRAVIASGMVYCLWGNSLAPALPSSLPGLGPEELTLTLAQEFREARAWFTQHKRDPFLWLVILGPLTFAAIIPWWGVIVFPPRMPYEQ